MDIICSSCKIPKDETHFYKSKHRKTGYNCHCKECGKIIQKRYENTDKGKTARQKTKKGWVRKTPPDLNGQTQTCSKCGFNKPYNLFVKNNCTSSGYLTICKACRAKDAREQYFLSVWGITISELEQMKILQNNACACCGETKKLVIDHNHKTGLIRELLCDKCNFAVGFLDDSPEKARKIAGYLEKHNNDVDCKRCLKPHYISWARNRKSIKRPPAT